MQTCNVIVKKPNLIFPFAMPNSVIAYKVDVSGTREAGDLTLKIQFKEPNAKDVAIPRARLKQNLLAAGYSLSRIGVMNEDLTEYVQERALLPLIVRDSPKGWIVVATDANLLIEVLKAGQKSGSSGILDKLAVPQTQSANA